MRRVIEQAVLGFNLAAFGSIALAALVAPRWTAAIVDYGLSSATAVGEFRAFYGGVGLALAALFTRALLEPGLRRPAVWLAACCDAGLAAGRLFTVATVGEASPLTLGFLASELLGLGMAVYVLRTPADSGPAPT